MSNPNLGQLRRLDPRTIWQHEAQQFTPWLADHIALLSEALGLEIEVVQREMPVGDFAVDIFGKEVGTGREVIIENQLGATDHGHLGQLLTYAAGLEAKIVIWISPEFRDEHSEAIDWLNRHSSEDVSFFGVELELLQIDESVPAPRFTVVAQPSEWQKQVSAEGKQERSQRQIVYHEFFVDFINRLNARSPGFTNIRRVGYESWQHFATGRSGFSFSVSFPTGSRFRVELEIDTGDYGANRLAFEQLYEEKDRLEEALGEPLVWERLEQRRACRIYIHQEEGNIDSAPGRLEELNEWAIERLLKFRDVFGPKLRTLHLKAPLESQLTP